MADLRARKGDKIICPECGEHCMTLAQDLFEDEFLREDVFEPAPGPWKLHDRIECRKCHADLFSLFGGKFLKIERTQG